MAARVASFASLPDTQRNPGRAISSLLKSQVAHFRQAEQTLPPDQQTGTDINMIQTERDASTYIGQVTKKLASSAGSNQQ
jgi:hypothetical protein